MEALHYKTVQKMNTIDVRHSPNLINVERKAGNQRYSRRSSSRSHSSQRLLDKIQTKDDTIMQRLDDLCSLGSKEGASNHEASVKDATGFENEPVKRDSGERNGSVKNGQPIGVPNMEASLKEHSQMSASQNEYYALETNIRRVR